MGMLRVKLRIIYKAICLDNNKFYIGKRTGKTLEQRKKEHERDVLKGSQKYFHKAMRKHGFDRFKWEILEQCYTSEWLKIREQYWIKKLKARGPKGYNCTDGGDGLGGFKHSLKTRKKQSKARQGTHPSKEAIERMSEAKKGIIPWNKNKQLSKEHKENLGKSIKKLWDEDKEGYLKKIGNDGRMTGKLHTEETKDKQSIARKKYWKKKGVKKKRSGKNHPMYGKHHTKESRKKDSKTMKEKWKDPEYRKKMKKAFKNRKRR